MNTTIRIIIVVLIAATVGSVFAYKSKVYRMSCPATGECPIAPITNAVENKPAVAPAVLPAAIENKAAVTPSAKESALPLLLDLGAKTCIPCKMMTPILHELTTEYSGKIKVEFIDVKENPAAAEKYNLEAIPTQIFFDSSGKELFRHVGFFAKDAIVKKWQELGITAQGENVK